jgi:hypothetical protein
MPLLGKLESDIEQVRATALQSNVKWIDLANRFPEPGEHVMVKMDDGLVEIGYWDSARAGWSHSPFERWGMPSAWAALPRSHSSDGFGR